VSEDPNNAQEPWWEPLYDDLLADVLLERGSAAEVNETLQFLEVQLRLAPGARVLDQCCGIGSLSVPLAQRGYEVLGIDQAAGYITRAKKLAERDRSSAQFAQFAQFVQFTKADAFKFVAAPQVDAAFNWWTSFGYAKEDAQNACMLARAFESIRPGGFFALDYMNVAGILRQFQPTVELKRVTARGELTLVRETDVDLSQGMMNKRWTFSSPNMATVVRSSSVKLYLPNTLADLLQSVGFEAPAFFGDTKGCALALESPRCIAVARRP
jgi:SAM-dependent methyltransferase